MLAGVNIAQRDELKRKPPPSEQMRLSRSAFTTAKYLQAGLEAGYCSLLQAELPSN